MSEVFVITVECLLLAFVAVDALTRVFVLMPSQCGAELAALASDQHRAAIMEAPLRTA
jgi:hypothetical protein